MILENKLFLDAALGNKTSRTPVWLMRQAGRILPEYRALRATVAGFKALVENPELACEVTLQPVAALGVDAAIIFSDILVIPEAMGLPYEIVEKKGPWFNKTIESSADVDALRIDGIEEAIKYTIDAIKLVKSELNGSIPLIGFAGAPWTIFAYMLEGSGSKTFSKARRMLYQNPELSHILLEKITAATITYLKAQIAAGADLVQVFDSHAGMLGANLFNQFALPYISKICDAINEVPITVFAKGAHYALSDINRLKCSVIGLDWTQNVKQAKAIVGNTKTLQGNLDPCALYGSTSDVKKATTSMLESFGSQGHIANLGHGVYPDTPLDSVKCFVDTVKSFEFKYA